MDKDTEKYPSKFSQEKTEFIDELTLTFGNVSEAAANVARNRGVTDPVEFRRVRESVRRLHYYWMTCDAEYSRHVEGIDELLLDLAEQKMKEHINAGNPDIIKFILKTKGKKRGYTERTETEITSGGEPLKINFNLKS